MSGNPALYQSMDLLGPVILQVVPVDLAIPTKLVCAALDVEKSLNFNSVFSGCKGFESQVHPKPCKSEGLVLETRPIHSGWEKLLDFSGSLVEPKPPEQGCRPCASLEGPGVPKPGGFESQSGL
jgi:hypothetical protein